jgi:hypothetical protein
MRSSPGSDVGKVVKLDNGERYLVTEGSLQDGWFGGQRIVHRGKGLRADVDGQEVWLNEMHRSLSRDDVVSIKPYREPRSWHGPTLAPLDEEAPALGPRSRLSDLAEHSR